MPSERTRPRLVPSETRCPFCRAELTQDEGVECLECGTRHHPGCFAEHGECSTFGCASREAENHAGPGTDLRAQAALGVAHGRHGTNAEGFAWLRRGLSKDLVCSHCDASCANDPLVANCSCNTVMHVDCYEEVGSCQSPACKVGPVGPLRIISPADAIQRRRWNVGSSMRNLGMIFGVPLLLGWVLLAFDSSVTAGTLVLATAMSVLCALGFFCGSWLRRKPSAAPGTNRGEPATKLEPGCPKADNATS
ncbi:MAG: hypothetical protein JKY65_18485 [Planctomycetes bacterium]|nr:hypothetical protein [Planctomycetota bacterium]